MLIITQDGSGDFTSLQAAIDAIPENNHQPITLLLRDGLYREKVIVNRNHVHLIGESQANTIITFNGSAKDKAPDGSEKGTFLSYTFLVTGDDVRVENLTIRNDAGDGQNVGQAVAVYAAGDRGVWKKVRLLAHQDTLFCGPTMPKVAHDALPRLVPKGVNSVGDCPLVLGRQYFESCWIQGDIDFIFGPYRCWFEKCTLFMNASGGYYTAANTPAKSPYGFVFHNCKLGGECPPAKAWLGRPWRAFAHTMFIKCEMDECVHPEGFQDWGDNAVTTRCGEYGTTGARAVLTTRHPSQARLSDTEAATYTLENVFDGWNPTEVTC